MAMAQSLWDASHQLVTDWKAPGRFTPKGTHFQYRGDGAGPLVVFVHGIGTYHVQFSALADQLIAQSFRVLLYGATLFLFFRLYRCPLRCTG
jgi:hypothetical protein